MISKESQELLAEMRKNRELWPDLSKRDYKKMQEIQSEMTSKFPVSEEIETTETNADGVPIEIWEIPGADNKYIFYIHGGGFLLGTAADGKHEVSNIGIYSKRNVIGVNYTLAVTAPFPAGLNDCATAYKWALKQGIKPEDIVFYGESAGGNLVLALGLWCKENDVPLPGGICAFSPASDLTFSSDSYRERMDREFTLNANTDEEVQSTYCKGADLKNPLVSPVYGDFTGFPPVSLHVASEELFYDDAVHMQEVLKRDGVSVEFRVWEEMCHAFLVHPLPESMQAYKEIAGFFNSL